MENPASEDASMASVQDSTGVDKDRGMCIEKRKKMNRFYTAGTLNSGGPGTVPAGVARLPRAGGDQPQEDAAWSFRESDPPIVVRDGNTGYMAKERAGGNASKALTPGHVDPDHRVTLPACNGGQFRHPVPELASSARFLRSPLR